MGHGVSSTGWGNARTKTNFADHWLHSPFQTRQVLLATSGGPPTGWNGFMGQGVSSTGWGNAQPCTTFDDPLLTLWNTPGSCYSTSRNIHLHCSSFRVMWASCSPHQLLCAFSLTISFFARSDSLIPRAFSIPKCPAPRLRRHFISYKGSRYFPFCARPAQVQAPTIVPLVCAASSLCMSKVRTDTVRPKTLE